MTYKFTNRAKKAIELANQVAIELGHNYIGTEHILYGLVKEGSGVASKVLGNQEVTPDEVIDKMIELIGQEVHILLYLLRQLIFCFLYSNYILLQHLSF